MSEIKSIGDPKTHKVVPVLGNSRFKTVGVLNSFKGEAATLIEFGSVGDANTVNLINTKADEIGHQVATGIYKYLYGQSPPARGTSKVNSVQKWHPPMKDNNKLNNKSQFNWYPFFK